MSLQPSPLPTIPLELERMSVHHFTAFEHLQWKRLFLYRRNARGNSAKQEALDGAVEFKVHFWL